MVLLVNASGLLRDATVDMALYTVLGAALHHHSRRVPRSGSPFLCVLCTLLSCGLPAPLGEPRSCKLIAIKMHVKYRSVL